ncbi:MAG: hypothetical protein EOP47_13320 [Sphingobacteriaceae bacterium]|nr:MAG: hypothetical protein EOP47_13320 [Sphingobacteriaceae bacterium]
MVVNPREVYHNNASCIQSAQSITKNQRFRQMEGRSLRAGLSAHTPAGIRRWPVSAAIPNAGGAVITPTIG